MSPLLAASEAEPTVEAPTMRPAVARRSITLDITRLLSRAFHATPTGIDRVEFAYARALLSCQGRRVGFEAWVPGLGFLSYAPAAVERLLTALERRWASGADPHSIDALRAWSGLRPSRAPGTDNLHLLVSHQHLADLHRRIRRKRGARTCVYVHDTIPSDFPEYARPGGAAAHDRRMRNAVALADAVIVNSEATARSLDRFMLADRRPELLVAPLGVEPPFRPGTVTAPEGSPYFLCLGTIEPRKNHLLLLHVWRALAERRPAFPLPRLILVGRRGWENENVVDLLDRSDALHGLVIEAGRVGDARLAELLAHARAVLMPSFAEGFGLPVVEALSVGAPVIANDIAVLRETGGGVPDFIDALDGPGWIRAILDYARPDSPMRSAQLARMQDWRAPRWPAHFDRVLAFLDGL